MKSMIPLIAVAFAATTAAAYGAEDKPASDRKPTSQQIRMKNCNAEAKEKALKKDERRAFMKSCLSNKPVQGA